MSCGSDSSCDETTGAGEDEFSLTADDAKISTVPRKNAKIASALLAFAGSEDSSRNLRVACRWRNPQNPSSEDPFFFFDFDDDDEPVLLFFRLCFFEDFEEEEDVFISPGMLLLSRSPPPMMPIIILLFTFFFSQRKKKRVEINVLFLIPSALSLRPFVYLSP